MCSPIWVLLHFDTVEVAQTLVYRVTILTWHDSMLWGLRAQHEASLSPRTPWKTGPSHTSKQWQVCFVPAEAVQAVLGALWRVPTKLLRPFWMVRCWLGMRHLWDGQKRIETKKANDIPILEGTWSQRSLRWLKDAEDCDHDLSSFVIMIIMASQRAFNSSSSRDIRDLSEDLGNQVPWKEVGHTRTP